jgi:hypothetical protein
MAADEIAIVAQQLGSSLLGVEIGNECDNYGVTGNYFAGQWSLSDFLSIWGQFQSAITARTPGIPFVGPASAGNVGTWTVPFGESVGKSKLALTTQHYYRGDGLSPAATAATLLSPDGTLASRLSTLQGGVQSSGIPYRMGECNSFYDGGAPGVSDTFAASLWSLDYMFTCAQAGASGVNFHGGGPYNSYSPIADNSRVPTSVRPLYYGLLFFAQAGSGNLCKTTVSAGGLNVTAYTVQNTAGRLTLTVVNKEPKQNLQLQVQLPRTAASASVVSLSQTSTSTATTSASIQGSAVAIDGTFEPSSPCGLSAGGTTVDCYVPAFSAVQIQIT